MAAKSGSRHHKAKLTEKQVIEMREKYAAGGTSYWKLAMEYDIDSGNTIGQIIRRRTWTHI
jgi:hypothetical protein